MTNVGDRYSTRYAGLDGRPLYPVEFVVRMFLGSYPRLHMDRRSFAGSRILDLGCGDGRNLQLLSDLGFSIHAVEITDEICGLVDAHARRAGLSAVVKQGSNSNILFEDGFFDYVLACHSLYYIRTGETFAHNLAEVARVLKPGGVLVASLPKKYDRYTLAGAEVMGDNHFLVKKDPLGLRQGTIFRVFEDQAEIVRVFGAAFTELEIGFIENDFFGIEERLWIVKMTRRGGA